MLETQNTLWVKQFPVALQKLWEALPSPAQDYIDKTLDLNQFLIQNQQATFIVEVESLSMRDAGINLNDKLIVYRSIKARAWGYCSWH